MPYRNTNHTNHTNNHRNINHNQHQLTPAYTKAQLHQQGFSRSQIQNQFDRVSKQLFVPLEARSPEATEAQRFTKFHKVPPLHHSMLQRIGFYMQENPNALLGGFSALALHGLTYWVNAAPLTVVTDYPCSRSTSGVIPLVREFDPAPPIRLFDLPAGPVHAVSIEHALVSALKDVLRGRCTWRALPIPPLSPVDVRVIQLIDAVCPLSAADLFSCARGRVDSRRLSRLFRLSDAHSESPPETLMRLLIVHDTVLGQLSWEPQVPILPEGVLGEVGKRYRNVVTIPDLLCRQLRIALYFDGAVHREQDTFERDTRISGNLHVFGWRFLRVTWGMLRNTEGFLRGLRRLVETARTAS